MCDKLRHYLEHSHHALLQLLELSVRGLCHSVDQTNEPLLCCSPLSCNLSQQGIQPGLVEPLVLLLLLNQLL